ncbi:hypothetical protein AALA82_13725 [Oscillospiraceae bacterium 50-16]
MEENTERKNKEKKIIKIELSEEEHQKVKESAKKRGLTLKEYGRMKVLDSTEGIDSISRHIACIVPKFNNLVEKVPDIQLRNNFYDWGSELWLCLR